MSAPRAPGNKKALVIVGTLAVVGGVIAIVVATRSSGEGASSPKAVVEGTLAALSSGDTGKLAKLANIDNLYASFVKCDKDKADETPAELAAHDKERLTKAADAAKGLKLKLVEMPDIDKLDSDHVTKLPKGSKLKKGCVSTEDARFVDAKVKITVQDGTKPATDREVEFELLDVGSRWYLGRAPKVDKSADASELIAVSKQFRDEMCACKDVDCVNKVNKDRMAWMTANRDKLNATAPSPEDVKAIVAVDEELANCSERILAH